MKPAINVDAALEHEGYGALAIGTPSFRYRGETIFEMLVSPGQAKVVSAINRFVAGVFRLLPAREAGRSAKRVLIRVERLLQEEVKSRRS